MTVLGAAAAGAVAVGVNTVRRAGVGRSALLSCVAFDLVGGLIAFQLQPTREQYREASLQSRLAFALVHVQPFAVPLTGQGSWRRAALRYTAAVASTVALEVTLPRADSRRVAANMLAASLSFIDLASDTSQQRWFGPVYLMKVIGGHGGVPKASPSPDRA